MRRRTLAGALVVAALAAAAILALLADAVFATSDELETRAELLGQPGTSESGLPSGLRFRIARDMLGADDDAALLDALAAFDRAQREDAPPEQALAAHAQVEAELGRIASGSGDRAVRSRAANLNGVLLVEDARLDRTSASRFLQLGLEAFRLAVTLDPANDDAAYNLELLVRLLREGQSSVGAESGSEGSSGAGASPGGTGY